MAIRLDALLGNMAMAANDNTATQLQIASCAA